MEIIIASLMPVGYEGASRKSPIIATSQFFASFFKLMPAFD